MNPVARNEVAPGRPKRCSWFVSRAHGCLFGLFLLAAAFEVITLTWPARSAAFGRWPQWLVLGSAAATSLAGLVRQRPLQNVAAAALVVLALGATTQFLDGKMDFWHTLTCNGPPGARRTALWTTPLLWLIILLNARGVARLVLWPWRRAANFGLYLIGLATALAVLMQPFANVINGGGSWLPQLGGSCALHLLAWAIAVAVILALITPLLLNKRPGIETVDQHAWLVWLVLAGLLLVGALAQKLWLPAVWIITHTVLIIGLVLWGRTPPSVLNPDRSA